MGEMADWINQDDPEEDRDQYAAWLEEKCGPFRITKIDNTKCRYHGCDNHKGQVEFYSEDVCARCHAEDIKYAAWLGEKLERIKGENMTDKCIVHGCINRKDQGEFTGDICEPCYNSITTGKVGPTTSFLKRLVKGDLTADKYKGLVVTLDKDYRFEDVDSIVTAIKMLKGVLEVVPSVASVDDCIIRERVAKEIEKKLLKVLHPTRGEQLLEED